MKTAIGIDIGGTKISMVLGTPEGKILARRKIATRTGSETKVCIRELAENLADLIKFASSRKLKVSAIGVGIPGAVDSIKGIVPRSPHLKGWKGMKLASLLRAQFRIPVFLANDANVAAVAEKVFGQARKCRDFVYMTVSTGIGGGIVVHGKLLEGTSFVAGEIGHMTLVPEGNSCKCGHFGCLEAYASGTAIARDAKEQILQGKRSSLAKYLDLEGRITARDVGLAAQEGDSLSIKVYEKAGYYLGIGIANLLNILNPEMVLLGGGVWKSSPPCFQKAMMKSCRQHAWAEAFKKVRIKKSKIKGSIGDIGALALAFEKLTVPSK